MDEEYIVPKLLDLAKVMYIGECFAKYSKQRDLYIFGYVNPFGEVTKNIVTKAVAIYIIINKLPKK